MSSCKLVIKDEVNVKFENLSLEWRKRLSNKFKYEIPYARHLPAVKLGRWDGKVSFFGLGGTTYLNLVDQIIPILENGMPTLLCEFLKPETDIFWSEVLVYDKGKYVSADRQRIKIKNR